MHCLLVLKGASSAVILLASEPISNFTENFYECSAAVLCQLFTWRAAGIGPNLQHRPVLREGLPKRTLLAFCVPEQPGMVPSA